MIEKPFGHDLESARQLNRDLHRFLDEDQILRTDHYLGKEPVMDILYLRFANLILEPVWHREYVDSIQITMSENIGVDDRGSFYDAVGTLRDVVQNHLLQVLALVTMEPPSGGPADADPIRDKKNDLFRAMPAADPSRYVRGQHAGYREIDGVAPDSQTETFVGLRLAIENWRWAGVPIFIRAGKAMPVEATEIRIVFKQPPRIGIGAGVARPRRADHPDQARSRRRAVPDLEEAGQGGVPARPPRPRLRGPGRRPARALRAPPPRRALRRPLAVPGPDVDRGDVADRPAAARRPAAGRDLRARRVPGPESASLLTVGHGAWRHPWLPE